MESGNWYTQMLLTIIAVCLVIITSQVLTHPNEGASFSAVTQTQIVNSMKKGQAIPVEIVSVRNGYLEHQASQKVFSSDGSITENEARLLEGISNYKWDKLKYQTTTAPDSQELLLCLPDLDVLDPEDVIRIDNEE